LCRNLISNDTKQIIIFFIGEDTDIGAFLIRSLLRSSL